MLEKHEKILRVASALSIESYSKEGVSSFTKLEDKETDCQCYVGRRDGLLYICGRGTTSLTDVKMDMQIKRTKVDYLNGSNVHCGFEKQYLSIRERLKDLIESGNDKVIVCCGHSLFGAVSTICALDLSLQFPEKIVHCVTFGSPRVGDSKFVKMFNESVDYSFRNVNEYDIVTAFPLRIRFKHVRGKRFVRIPKFKSIFTIIKDHSMRKYNSFFNKEHNYI